MIQIIRHAMQGIFRALGVFILMALLPLEIAYQDLEHPGWLIACASGILILDGMIRIIWQRAQWRVACFQIGIALPWEILFWPLVFLRIPYFVIWFFQGSARKQLRSHFLIPLPIERTALSAVGILVLVHWTACLWIRLGGAGFSENATLLYVDALYWTVVTMASVGYGDITPHTLSQKLFAIGVIFVGVGIYGYIIGNVATLLASMDRAKEKHRTRIAEMSSWLNFRRVPKELQRRVVEHMHALWDKRLALDDSVMLEQLPTHLRTELAAHMHSALLANVPLWKDAPPLFIAELASRLQPMFFPPQETIFAKGERGHEMFFVASGQVEVMDPSGQGVVATLQKGAFFGEIALLSQVPRTATVRTLEPSELYALKAKDFQATLDLFPEFAEQVQKISKERYHAILSRSQCV